MINRILIRIKVVQILYAYFMSEDKPLKVTEKELHYSFERVYELYFHLLSLSLHITRMCADKIELRKNKFRPTYEDLHPNLRFIDNRFVKQLAENLEFRDFIKQHKLSWTDYADVIKELVNQMENSDFYKEYMMQKISDYEHDKEVWHKIFKNIIAVNKALKEALEEQSIYWADNLEIILSFIFKTIRRFENRNDKSQKFIPKFNSEEDKVFAEKLLATVINRDSELTQMIDTHTKNWEFERIAFMDILIMKMALAEILAFPTIPVSVTMNEYIELAKEYSTEKSSLFINGVLDTVVNELKNDKKFIKVAKFNE
ncbi:MAG: transcription antitermination factor NusB [Prevotellaceae bacterium]|jgi:N utilization substance protein B|nr:transcription antitermination factor NusB [Prevotellaceae bacterium]